MFAVNQVGTSMKTAKSWVTKHPRTTGVLLLLFAVWLFLNLQLFQSLREPMLEALSTTTCLGSLVTLFVAQYGCRQALRKHKERSDRAWQAKVRKSSADREALARLALQEKLTASAGKEPSLCTSGTPANDAQLDLPKPSCRKRSNQRTHDQQHECMALEGGVQDPSEGQKQQRHVDQTFDEMPKLGETEDRSEQDNPKDEVELNGATRARYERMQQHLNQRIAAGERPQQLTPTPLASRTLNYIPLDVAREANERQEQWIQHLHEQVNPEIRYQRDRAILAEQDAEYEAAVAADAAYQQTAQEEEQRVAAAADRETKLHELKIQLRESLPDEPPATFPAGSGSNSLPDGVYVVSVRVRLPDGSSDNRRWLSKTNLQQVYDWVQSLDAFPLWEPDSWQLASSFPRVIFTTQDFVDVHQMAQGSTTLALFVQRT